MSDVRIIQRFQPKSRRCIETDIVVPPDHDGNYVLYADHKVLIEAKDREIAELKAENARLLDLKSLWRVLLESDDAKPLIEARPEFFDQVRDAMAGDK